jgi:hypothetical protein
MNKYLQHLESKFHADVIKFGRDYYKAKKAWKAAKIEMQKHEFGTAEYQHAYIDKTEHFAEMQRIDEMERVAAEYLVQVRVQITTECKK